MTITASASKRMVASPRYSSMEDGLDELLFGPLGSTKIHDYIHRFYALNGGPVVVP